MNESVTRFVEPAAVCTQFHIQPGDTVADFGAGRGYFLEPLAKAVGAEGIVYALEIQKNLVETMGAQVREQNLSTVRVVWADIEEPRGSTLEDTVLDVAILVNTLFQFEDKAAALTEIHRALRPGGKLFIIDWSESFGNLGPTPDAVVSSVDAESLAGAAGFVSERTYPAGDHHYGLAFRKG